MADNIMTFRTVIKEVAIEQGVYATFMPKPLSGQPGSGMHTHMSLFEGDRNAFHEPGAPLELSKVARSFIAGLLRHAAEITAVTNQFVNSYKRLKVGSTTSGATWSPVWISYGYNNRTQMLRIPAPGRVEDRTIDGSANPYLAATAVLAAGLDGIENRLDAGEANSDNLYEKSHDELSARGLQTLPANLLEAIGELERDDVLRSALGRGRGEDYVDYYCRVKRDEWFRYHEQVTDWEIKEYLTRF